MTDLRHEIGIESSAANILKAITTQEGLRTWWTSDVEAEPTEGSTARFGFMGRAVVFTMTVERINPEGVVWKCIDGPADWVGTTQKFALLEGEDGETLLRFTHGGWKDDAPSLPRCNTTWGHLMVNLKRYVEDGKATPYFN